MAVAKYLHRYPILGKIYVKNDICSQRRRLLSIPFPLQSTIFFFRKGWAAKNSRSHRAFQLHFQQWMFPAASREAARSVCCAHFNWFS